MKDGTTHLAYKPEHAVDLRGRGRDSPADDGDTTTLSGTLHENVYKRYLIHVAGHNLGVLMRLLIGAGTPKEAAARVPAFLFVNYREDTLAIVIFALDKAALGILVVIVTAELT